MCIIPFIIVDRLPKTGKTQKAADAIDAEIIQMSMGYWVRELAQKLTVRFGAEYELEEIPDEKLRDFLNERLATIPVQEFLTGVSTEALIEQAEEEAEEACPEDGDDGDDE